MAKKSQSGNNEMSSKTRGANKASSRMKKQAVSFKSGKRTPKVLQKKPSSFRFKIVVVGYDGVGKTSMVQQAVGEKDRQKELKKTNPHYYPKTLYLKKTEFIDTGGPRGIELYIFDSEGSEGQYLVDDMEQRRTADAVIMMYDITKWSTFEEAKTRIREIKENTETPASILSIIGNKSDLEERRQVSMEDGQLFAEENGLLFKEISSTSQKDAPDLFEDIAFELYVSKVLPNLIPFQDNPHSTC